MCGNNCRECNHLLHSDESKEKTRRAQKRFDDICEIARLERAKKKQEGTWNRKSDSVLEVGDRMTFPLIPDIEPNEELKDVEAKCKFTMIRLDERKDMRNLRFQEVFGKLFKDVDEKARRHWEEVQEAIKQRLVESKKDHDAATEEFKEAFSPSGTKKEVKIEPRKRPKRDQAPEVDEDLADYGGNEEQDADMEEGSDDDDKESNVTKDPDEEEKREREERCNDRRAMRHIGTLMVEKRGDSTDDNSDCVEGEDEEAKETRQRIRLQRRVSEIKDLRNQGVNAHAMDTDADDAMKLSEMQEELTSLQTQESSVNSDNPQHSKPPSVIRDNSRRRSKSRGKSPTAETITELTENFAKKASVNDERPDASSSTEPTDQRPDAESTEPPQWYITKVEGDSKKRFFVHQDGTTEETSDGGTKTVTPPKSPRGKSPTAKDKEDKMEDSDPEHAKKETTSSTSTNIVGEQAELITDTETNIRIGREERVPFQGLRQNYSKVCHPTDGGPRSLTIWIKSNRRIGKFLALPMYFVHMHSCSNSHSLRIWLTQNTSGYMVK